MHSWSLRADHTEANAVTHSECPDSLKPELKACALQLFPVNVDLLMGQYETQGSHYSVVD